MELSRKSIERADFPRTADGLDPEAVAEHLREVAEAVERLSQGAKGSGADRVSRVVAAAEAAAAELEESAREDADRIRTEAAEAVAGLPERASALQAQLDQLAGSASKALAELTDAARAGASAVSPGAPVDPEPKVAPAPAPKPESKSEPKPEPAPEPTVEPAPPEPAASPTAAAAANGEPIAGGEAPRLIALNMALNGASRDEISRYLSENFELDDSATLLDEVWARVNG